MSPRHTLSILGLFVLSFLEAQVTLPYSINNPFTPDDSAVIDPVVTYHDTSNQFVSSGFNTGDTVPDFNLPDTNYQNVKLSDVLNDGKPVILVSISYSCPASRESMQITLPNLMNQFGPDVNFVLVYIVEAHPVYPDWSPYFDTVNTTPQNFTDSVLIRQETRYYQRKYYANFLDQQYHTHTQIVLDDYNNDYWNTFGSAPNNCYLLKPSGEVFSKYGWFVQHQNTLIHDVEQLLTQLSIEQPLADFTMNIFPNPANGLINIQTGIEQEWTLEITDETGRVVRHIEHISSADYQLDCSDLKKGSYFFSITNGTNSIHRLVIAGN